MQGGIEVLFPLGGDGGILGATTDLGRPAGRAWIIGELGESAHTAARDRDEQTKRSGE